MNVKGDRRSRKKRFQVHKSTFAVPAVRYQRKNQVRDWLKNVILRRWNGDCYLITSGDLPLQYIFKRNLLEPALASFEVLNIILDFVPLPTTAYKPRINIRKICFQACRVMTFYACNNQQPELQDETQKRVNTPYVKLRAELSDWISDCWLW